MDFYHVYYMGSIFFVLGAMMFFLCESKNGK
jgi:hypothetical protein